MIAMILRAISTLPCQKLQIAFGDPRPVVSPPSASISMTAPVLVSDVLVSCSIVSASLDAFECSPTVKLFSIASLVPRHLVFLWYLYIIANLSDWSRVSVYIVTGHTSSLIDLIGLIMMTTVLTKLLRSPSDWFKSR